MRTVLVLAYMFPPLGGAGAQRALKLLPHLPAHGYRPVVLTGEGSSRDYWSPVDSALADEVPPEVTVVRLNGREPDARPRWRRRLEDVLDRPPPFRSWFKRMALESADRIHPRPDILLAELGPYDTAEAAPALAGALKCPWVADLQDPWALDEMWLYPTGIHLRRDRGRMRRILQGAAGVVMNTAEAAGRVRAAFPELADRPLVAVPNGYDAADFAAPPPVRSDRSFRIVHTGSLHTLMGMELRASRRRRRLLGGMPNPDVDILPRSHVYLLEAIERGRTQSPELFEPVEVHLIGPLTDADRAVSTRSPSVRSHGFLPHRETLELIRSADLLFLPMHALPDGSRAGLVPTKTYEYLASGRPILAAVPPGDARDLLIEAGNASVCDPSDVGGLAMAIVARLEAWRAGADLATTRAEVVERYEYGRLAGCLSDVLERARVRSR
jgi:glycosyltransferase involved in cell wall biosynthesis